MKFALRYQILGSRAGRTNEEAPPPWRIKGLIAAPPDVSEKAEEVLTHPESF